MTLQWASPSPYIVNGPSEKGAYSFSGMRRGSGRKDTPAGDASWERVTVQQPRPLVRPTNNPPTFSVEAASVFAGVTGGFSLSLTTTILPEHPCCSAQRADRDVPTCPIPRTADDPRLLKGVGQYDQPATAATACQPADGEHPSGDKRPNASSATALMVRRGSSFRGLAPLDPRVPTSLPADRVFLSSNDHLLYGEGASYPTGSLSLI